MLTSRSQTGTAIEQIPLKIRRCFVRSILLLTRYPQLGGKDTGGTYNSPLVSSYKCDRLPDVWYQADAAIKLCQLFKLSNSYAEEIQELLTCVDRKIDRRQEIIDALISNFDRLSTQKDALNLFQALFGNVPIPAASIKCLTTKMQITFIIDYEADRLDSPYLWCSLSDLEQQQISQFLAQISQFSFQQFAHFPGFNSVKVQNNLGLWRYLTEVTDYGQAEIEQAIASGVNIISANKAESFLLHDIWGHCWQSMLTEFENEYLYLSQVDEDLSLDSAIENGNNVIYLRQLFKLQNQSIDVDVPLAKQFFHCMVTKRIAALSTHLIGEMLADINEYKWLSQNRDRQALLDSSSSFPDSPTKLDLTIKDWDFLYLRTLETLIKLSPVLEADLINYFQIKDNESVYKLRAAISNLEHIFLAEYIYYDQSRQESGSSSLILSLTKLQSILNKLYNKSISCDFISFQDLILLFVSNYYSVKFEQDIAQVNFTLENHFYPCWKLLSMSTSFA
ncbi:MAG: hypothetical protein AAGM46_09075 [Cyanobacteria bacterium J06582_2]